MKQDLQATTTNYAKGVYAEQLALEFFQKKGFICLQRRFKTSVGEIDLVMAEKELLVFVEVKYRKVFSKGLHALQPEQAKRLWACAEVFLGQSPSSWQHIRFDLIAVNSKKELFHLPFVILN